MSALAPVPQKSAGLSAFIARKTSPGGAQVYNPDADFKAALAQTADASPAPKTLSPSTSDAPRLKGDDAIWRSLAAVSDDAKAPPTAGAPSSALAPNAQGALPGETGEEFSGPALDPKPAPTAKAQPTAVIDGQDSRDPANPKATPAPASSATTPDSDASPARPSRAASPLATSSLSSARAAPERHLRTPSKTVGEADAASTADPAAALKAEAAPSTTLPTNPPTACADPGLASTVPVPPAQQSESAAISPSTDQDSVALIGAALASPGARSAVGAQQAAASDPSLKEAEETPYEATTTAIHVVAQQTWLPPVSPAFSPGLSRQAAADHAAPETSQAASGKTKDLAGDKEAAAIETKSSVPTADSAPEKAPQTPFASVLSSGGGKFEPGRGEAPKPAATAAPTPTASSDAPPTILAATPRKDLEITLAPKELGGLEVRMKSAGDRLELAFVADRGETARMISDKSAALASQLHGAGLGQGGIDISSTASGQGGGGEGPPGGGRSPHPSSGEQPARRQESQGRDRQDRNNETNKQTGDAPSRGQRGLYL